MGYKYSLTGFRKDHMARAVGVALPVSRKQSIEISNAIRKRPVAYAKKFLEGVISQKEAVPFKRFNRDMGHKPGIAMGRYPVKASTEIKKLLESAESNAQFKGLNTSGLVISHMNVQQAPVAMKHGRQGRRQTKRATIEIVLEESKKQEKATKKTAPKQESKPAAAPKKKAEAASAPKAQAPQSKPAEKKAEDAPKKEAQPKTESEPAGPAKAAEKKEESSK